MTHDRTLSPQAPIVGEATLPLQTPRAPGGPLPLDLGSAAVSPSAENHMGGRVRFVDLAHDSEQREKVLRREEAVLRVKELQSAGIGIELALQLVSNSLRAEGVRPASISALRVWIARYDEHALDGLVEQKQGRVGRRAVQIPEQIVYEARAAAIEYGTLGKYGQQNIARAYREVVVTHPDATPEMREAFHCAHASKSHVPPSVRAALRVSPDVRDRIQGPKAARLHSPYTPCDWSNVKAGRVVTGDDMTCNVYCWVEFPSAKGFIVVRPQLIALLDCGSLRWLTARLVVRPNGQYNSDDVWGVIGDLADSYGIYPEFLFEGGVWRSNKVRGDRTGLHNDDRFGGLRTFGAILRHAHTPRAKPVEQQFGQLQHAMDRLPGYAGRNEREDCPEKTKAILEAIRTDKLHPRGHLLHLTDLREHIVRIMEGLNNERQDGEILRGMSPQEKWDLDAPKFAAFPDSAKWLYRSAKNIVAVLRDGQLRLTVGSGKFKSVHIYRNADVLRPFAGRRVIAYWNQDHPEADCIILDAETKKFIGAAQYVTPLPRFDATSEQMQANGETLAAYRRAVKTELVDLAPYLQRQQAVPVPVDAVTEENGRALLIAQEKAKSAKATRARVSERTRVEIPDDLRDYAPRVSDCDPTKLSEETMADLLGDHPLTQ